MTNKEPSDPDTVCDVEIAGRYRGAKVQRRKGGNWPSFDGVKPRRGGGVKIRKRGRHGVGKSSHWVCRSDVETGGRKVNRIGKSTGTSRGDHHKVTK
jgi:hypothetical protein